MMLGLHDNTTSRALVLDDRPRPSAREIFGGSLGLRRDCLAQAQAQAQVVLLKRFVEVKPVSSYWAHEYGLCLPVNSPSARAVGTR